MDCNLLRSSCPWDFPSKNIGVEYHFLRQGSSWPRDWTWISCIAGRFFTMWAHSFARTTSKEVVYTSEITISHIWNLEAWDQGVSRVGFLLAKLSPHLPQQSHGDNCVSSPCLPYAYLPVQISPSEDTRHSGLEATLRTSF